MGTNFYWKLNLPTIPPNVVLPNGKVVSLRIELGGDEDDADRHIGKRSAAGLFCWDCRTTLCKGGENHVHLGRSTWLDACPQCGLRQKIAGSLDRGPVAVELGFAKPESSRPTGVTGCSSFTWAQDPAEVRVACEANIDKPIIEDEYGDCLTGQQFLTMLAANCPIEFTDSVGTRFS